MNHEMLPFSILAAAILVMALTTGISLCQKQKSLAECYKHHTPEECKK